MVWGVADISKVFETNISKFRGSETKRVYGSDRQRKGGLDLTMGFLETVSEDGVLLSFMVVVLLQPTHIKVVLGWLENLFWDLVEQIWAK